MEGFLLKTLLSLFSAQGQTERSGLGLTPLGGLSIPQAVRLWSHRAGGGVSGSGSRWGHVDTGDGKEVDDTDILSNGGGKNTPQQVESRSL